MQGAQSQIITFCRKNICPYHTQRTLVHIAPAVIIAAIAAGCKKMPHGYDRHFYGIFTRKSGLLLLGYRKDPLVMQSDPVSQLTLFIFHALPRLHASNIPFP